MVITFSDDTAFGFLADEGFVVTARASQRANPTGDNWAARERGGQKVADVYIHPLGDAIDPLDKVIDRLAPFSGFESGDDWRRAMRDLNDGLPDDVHLYFVSIRDWVDDHPDSPQRLIADGGDGPGTHVEVQDWKDIDQAPDKVSGQAKDLVAQLFRDGLPHDYEAIVWLPDFKVDELEGELELVEKSDHLAVGMVEDYSDKAWRVTQPHRKNDVEDYGIYAPKSWTIVFEKGGRLDDLDRPQAGLTDF